MPNYYQGKFGFFQKDREDGAKIIQYSWSDLKNKVFDKKGVYTIESESEALLAFNQEKSWIITSCEEKSNRVSNDNDDDIDDKIKVIKFYTVDEARPVHKVDLQGSQDSQIVASPAEFFEFTEDKSKQKSTYITLSEDGKTLAYLVGEKVLVKEKLVLVTRLTIVDVATNVSTLFPWKRCTAVSFSRLGKYIAIGDEIGNVAIYDRKNLNFSYMARVHSGEVLNVTFNGDETKLISTSKGFDKTSPIKVWDFEVALPSKHCGYPPFEVKCIGFKTGDDDKYILNLFGSSEKQTWNVFDNERSEICSIPETETDVKLDPICEKDGVCYTGTEYGVIEVKQGSSYAPLKAHLTKMVSVVVSDDKLYIAALSEEGIVTVWKKDEKGFNYSLHSRMTPAPYLILDS